MSKNGKLKKAKNIEKRRLQMEEALECLPLKEAAQIEPVAVVHAAPVEHAAPALPVAPPARKAPKQCAFAPCSRYVDSSCTVCPYCGHPLPD